MRNTHKELIESVAGNGETQYSVVTIKTATGQWRWKEDFASKAEAESWIKYA